MSTYTSCQPRIGAWGACLCAATMTLGAAATAAADSKAIATYSVNGGPVKTLVILASPGANGTSLYNATVQIPEDSISITWNYMVDNDPEGNASFNGNVTVVNSASKVQAIMATVDFELCPELSAGSYVGCVASLKGVTNVNGGAITCGVSDVLAQITYDGEFGDGLYYCPFTMSKTGMGTVTTNITYGTPVPSKPGPEKVSTMGMKLDISLTDGDKAILNTYFGTAIDGQLSQAVSTCDGDLNGDGMVNDVDLIILTNMWGVTGGCSSADYNGNGLIDPQDMAVLLNNWGLCPLGR